MHLLSGPPGSGKTSIILDQFRAQTSANVRLLVPTATMARHLQNRLAREGLVLRRSLIQTLSGFIRDWVEDTPEVPRPVLHLITEEAARRVAHPDFARVVSLPGFSARLAATIHEFSGAGCDSSRLAAAPPAPYRDRAHVAGPKVITQDRRAVTTWCQGPASSDGDARGAPIRTGGAL